MSDRHPTVKVGMHRGDHEVKTAWQTRWLVAVHLDPLKSCGSKTRAADGREQSPPPNSCHP